MIAEASRTLGNEDLIDRRVLVVDDDPTVAEVVAEYLRSAGFVVDRVADGFEAIEAEARISPDLIVLDRMLPGIDGIEACRRIRRTSATPIILLTALGSEDERIRGFEAGADDYLTKPFSPRELVLRVQSVLRRSLGDFAPESAARSRSVPRRPGRARRDDERQAALAHGAGVRPARRSSSSTRVRRSAARSCSPRCGAGRTATCRR